MKRSYPLIFLFLLLLIKISIAYIYSNQIRLWEDHDIALNLAKTGSFWIDFDGTISHTYQFPVYPFLVSLLYKTFDCPPFSAVVLNLIFNFFTSIVLLLLFKRLVELFFSKLSAKHQLFLTLIPLILYTLHPGITYYAMFNVHPFSSNQFFLMLVLYLSFPVQAHSIKMSYLLSLGIVAGLAMLDRATCFLGFLPLFVNLLMQTKTAIALKYTAIIGGVAFITVLPWLVRNYKTDGLFGFETSAGKDLWKGSIPESEGSNYLINGEYYFSKVTKEEFANMHHMTPKEQYIFFTNKWKQNINKYPTAYIKLYLKKLRNFWWFRPNFANEHNNKYINTLIILYKIFWAIILLGCISLTFSYPKTSIILLSSAIALSLFQSIFYVESRHRMIIEPLLTFVAVAGYFLSYYHFTSKTNKNLC